MQTNSISFNPSFGAIKYQNMSPERVKQVLGKTSSMRDKLTKLTELQTSNPINIYIRELKGGKVAAEVGNYKFLPEGRFSNVFEPIEKAIDYVNGLRCLRRF